MTLRIILSGATGWTGAALARAILAAPDLTLVAAVARTAAGRDIGEALGGAPAGLLISGSLDEALKVPADVLIDYTRADLAKAHVLAGLDAGLHVVVGTSGLDAADYAEIDARAREKGLGVHAAGNYSITATLMKRFALEAAKYVDDVEVIDYAFEGKPDAPSGSARELAEALSDIRRPATSVPVDEVVGLKECRGGGVGEGAREVRVHSVRMPSFVFSIEAILGAPDERLLIRHDAGASATPYVAGTLLAARRVSGWAGVKRGLDSVLD
ncbi:4-hydroxy-tetrahydrodipicolinate reductase [Ancylobacter sp. 6x-1]|uniref:4-hydroxy-tetrahydrodipicolinate reductase n=1 Tax=Ancylobacter crimeensis TaxID=2579147 RepID=A0ABT0DE11_9HYPH|nr:4-hydroxy-tetrahydrodipicolinate reductase [Ancylobacter crimeensis]MCK0198209.1 4-hydroxy-tetrahydrodipicolinate reductase [Ancylobacter crimeensis]